MKTLLALLLSFACTRALILPSARAALRLPIYQHAPRSAAVLMGKKGGKPKGAKSGGGVHAWTSNALPRHSDMASHALIL